MKVKNEILIIVLLILAGLYVYILVKYGNTPLSDVPFWVVWLLSGNRG